MGNGGERHQRGDEGKKNVGGRGGEGGREDAPAEKKKNLNPPRAL